MNIEIATPAKLRLGRTEGDEVQEVKKLHELSVVSGEEVELVCEARGAYPLPDFVWNIPGEWRKEMLKNDVHNSHILSKVTYTARIEDDGSIVRCSSVQTSPLGDILYKESTNLTLHVTQPAPLLATRSSHVGILTGGLLAVVLVIFIISILVFVCKKKKRINSGRERINNKISASENKDVEKIWVTKTSLTHPDHHGSSDSQLQCRAEVHNSSSSSRSSNTSSSLSTFSSHEVLSPKITPKDDLSKLEKQPNPSQGNIELFIRKHLILLDGK